MPREVQGETVASRRTTIAITLNRAALGDAELVFAKMESVDGGPNIPIFVPRKNITVKEQPLTGEEFYASLEADVLEDHGSYLLVETEGEFGSKYRFKVNKKQGKIEPIRHRAIFTGY